MKQGKKIIIPRGRPKPTLEEIEKALQYLEEEINDDKTTLKEVREFVDNLKK